MPFAEAVRSTPQLPIVDAGHVQVELKKALTDTLANVRTLTVKALKVAITTADQKLPFEADKIPALKDEKKDSPDSNARGPLRGRGGRGLAETWDSQRTSKGLLPQVPKGPMRWNHLRYRLRWCCRFKNKGRWCRRLKNKGRLVRC